MKFDRYVEKKYFNEENTDGFSIKQINRLNILFPEFAHTYGFDLTDEQEYKSCADRFFNSIAIDISNDDVVLMGDN